MCTFKASTHYVTRCGDAIEVEREAWTNPFVCTHRTYVAGTVDKLMHKKPILVRFYVVPRTDCKRSATDAKLKIEVNRHFARFGHMVQNQSYNLVPRVSLPPASLSLQGAGGRESLGAMLLIILRRDRAE